MMTASAERRPMDAASAARVMVAITRTRSSSPKLTRDRRRATALAARFFVGDGGRATPFRGLIRRRRSAARPGHGGVSPGDFGESCAAEGRQGRGGAGPGGGRGAAAGPWGGGGGGP